MRSIFSDLAKSKSRALERRKTNYIILKSTIQKCFELYQLAILKDRYHPGKEACNPWLAHETTNVKNQQHVYIQE